MLIFSSNDPSSVFESHFTSKCPNCNTFANMSAISIPRYEFLERFTPKVIGIVYRCDACNSPVFFKCIVASYQPQSARVILTDDLMPIQRPLETLKYNYIPQTVREDFEEAFNCYSQGSFNAFAAMSRRTIQTEMTELGVEGNDKVLNQLNELKEITQMEDETYSTLKQIILDGHDGAHPHLPKLSEERAVILLELMKDVMYQLFVPSA